MVPGVPAGERPRRPTSLATAGRERQHHTLTYSWTTPSCTIHIKRLNNLEDLTPTYTILTAIESTTGLCTGVLTSKKGYTPHQAAQLHRWIGKHGFTKSILQSDANTSLMAAGQHRLGRPQLTYKSVTSLLTSESRKVEGFHQNLFDQLRTTRLQWSKDLKVEPHVLPPESFPWALQHSIFIIDNYLAHSSEKTSRFENYH